MKRPLAVFGFSLFAFLLCFVICDSKVLVGVSFFIAAASFFVILLWKKLRRLDTVATAFIALAVSCLLFFTAEARYENAISKCSERAFVSGKVCESPEFSSDNMRYYCIIKVDTIDGEHVDSKMRLSFRKSWDNIDPDELTVGSRLAFYGKVYHMGDYAGEEYVRYYKSKGIYLGSYSIEELEITETEFKSIFYYISKLRDYIIKRLSHDFDKDVSAVLTAVLTGEKDGIDDGIYDDFRRAGVLHIMAVSGLHLSVWIMLFIYFVDTGGRRGRLNYIPLIIFVLFMMSFAGFTGSVCRAGAMSLLFLTAKLLNKNSDSLNNLGFSCVCILFVNPFSVTNISFMLSFVSTLSILISGVPLANRISLKMVKSKEDSKLRKVIYPVVLSLAISFSVMIFTLPLCIYYFGGISLASPLTNLLFYLIIMPVVFLTGIYPALRLIPFVGKICASALNLLAGYMINVCKFISDFEFSYIELSSSALFVIFFISAFIAALALGIKKYLKR